MKWVIDTLLPEPGPPPAPDTRDPPREREAAHNSVYGVRAIYRRGTYASPRSIEMRARARKQKKILHANLYSMRSGD